MHLVLGEKAPTLISQQVEASTMPTTKIQRGINVLYSTGQSIVGAISELGKNIDLLLDGKILSREYKAGISERKRGHCVIFRCKRMPPKV